MIQREHSARDFLSRQGLKSAGILCVFQTFRTDGSAKNVRRRLKANYAVLPKKTRGCCAAQRPHFFRRGSYENCNCDRRDLRPGPCRSADAGGKGPSGVCPVAARRAGARRDVAGLRYHGRGRRGAHGRRHRGGGRTDRPCGEQRGLRYLGRSAPRPRRHAVCSTSISSASSM